MAVEPPVFPELTASAKAFPARLAYPSTCYQVVKSLLGASFPKYYLHNKETVMAKAREKKEKEKRKGKEGRERKKGQEKRWRIVS